MTFPKPKFRTFSIGLGLVEISLFIFLSCCTSKPVQEQISEAHITETPFPTQKPLDTGLATAISTDTPMNVVIITATMVPSGTATTIVPPTNSSVSVPGGSLFCRENLIAGSPWILEAENDADEAWIDFSDPYILSDKDAIRITFNLNGLMAQEGDRKNDSTVVFTQSDSWFGITLINPKYGAQNGSSTEQTVYIPLTDFVEIRNPDKGIVGGAPLDLNAEVSSLRSRFWYRDHFSVEITDIALCFYQN